jgi:hypothetical protein
VVYVFCKTGYATLGAYMFTIVISSWYIVLFVNMKWTSLSIMTNFVFKCVLSDVSIAIPVCSWDPFAGNIFFYPAKGVRFLQTTNDHVLFFLIYSANQCIMIGELQPLTFSYYWKVYNNSCHYIVFIMFNSFLMLIAYLSTQIYSFPYFHCIYLNSFTYPL